MSKRFTVTLNNRSKATYPVSCSSDSFTLSYTGKGTEAIVTTSTPSTPPTTAPTYPTTVPTYPTTAPTYPTATHTSNKVTTLTRSTQLSETTIETSKPAHETNSSTTTKTTPALKKTKKPSDKDKAVIDNVGNSASPDNAGSGMIAAVIVGVVCFVVVLIVIGVLSRKVWSDHNRRRFRNVDYLINGMYT